MGDLENIEDQPLGRTFTYPIVLYVDEDAPMKNISPSILSIFRGMTK